MNVIIGKVCFIKSVYSLSQVTRVITSSMLNNCVNDVFWDKTESEVSTYE
jgi:hypothetical protein